MAKKATKKAASAPVKLDTGRLEHIAFRQLALSPLNVRKNAEVGPEDEFVATICDQKLDRSGALLGEVRKLAHASGILERRQHQ